MKKIGHPIRSMDFEIQRLRWYIILATFQDSTHVQSPLLHAGNTDHSSSASSTVGAACRFDAIVVTAD